MSTIALRTFGRAAVLWTVAAGSAWAHSGDATGFVALTIRGDTVSYRLTPTGGTTGAAAPLSEKITIAADGRPCRLTSATEWDLDFRCDAIPAELRIRDDLADALGDQHHVIGMATWAGGSQSFDLSSRQREATVALAATGTASPQGAVEFFLLGVEHIVTGYDHLLFLLMLVLCGGHWVQLLKIVTAFTLAHSITLGAAALDLVRLPSYLVEAVIALSIAYVAFENLLPRFAVSRRWHISFLFGLVHGFGFSSVLKEIGLPKDSLIWSLLNFNLGVEAGQLVAVLIAVPLLIQLRKTSHEARVVRGLSAAVLVVGLALFVERVLFGA